MPTIKVPSTDEDHAEIKAAAKLIAVSVAAFMRLAALKMARGEK